MPSPLGLSFEALQSMAPFFVCVWYEGLADAGVWEVTVLTLYL